MDAIKSRWPAAWRLREARFPLDITFVRPSKTRTVSLTGHECDLDCAHCGGRYLRGMAPIDQVQAGNSTSLLVSGGCDVQGRVPFQPHIEAIERLCEGRRANWHVGLADVADLAPVEHLVDTVSFDFVGDDETIAEVYGLERTVDDYARTYHMLRQRVRVIPHITVGLHAGRIVGERRAIALLRELGLDALVFIVLIPTRGTRYETVTPPAPSEVAELIARARIEMPDVPIYLGCMRPSGAYRQELDPLAVEAGVNKIVNPSPAAMRRAGELGLRALWQDECCALASLPDAPHE